MKITDEIKKRKTPIVTIKNELNKFDEKVLFPEKLAKANKTLDRLGLPKQWKQ